MPGPEKIKAELDALLNEARNEPNPVIREAMLKGAEVYFRAHAYSLLDDEEKKTIGALVMGDSHTYNINNSQVGALGPNSKAEGNTFFQNNPAAKEDVDLPALAKELSGILPILNQKAKQSDDYISIGELAKAEKAATKGDREQALAALTAAGPEAFESARDSGADLTAETILKTMPGVVTDLDMARIDLWDSRLNPDDILLEEPILGDEFHRRMLRLLERKGICQIRLTAHDPAEDILKGIARMLGELTEYQNEFIGSVKRITPKPEGALNSGDTSQDLGFHVDGTQHPDTPELLIFHYETVASVGAISLFMDTACALSHIEEPKRSQLIKNLARHDAAVFEKKGMRFEGPIFQLTPGNTLRCRLRFDGVITPHPECQDDFELLKEIFTSGRFNLEFRPREGDVVVFDNWRVMHARTEVSGIRQRAHWRGWIDRLKPGLQPYHFLGIRPVPLNVLAEIEEANKQS